MTPVGWAILLFLLGLAFLALEFFVPSGGALAAMCALSFLAAIVIGFLASAATGLGILVAVCVVVPAAVAAAVRWWPDTPIGRLMLVERPQSPSEVLPDTLAYRGLSGLVGRRGQSRGLMLPSGSVLIDGKTYDAITEGMAIEPHQPIVVTGVSTQRLIVRPDTTIRAELAAADHLDQQALLTQQSPHNQQGPLVPDIPDPFAET